LLGTKKAMTGQSGLLTIEIWNKAFGQERLEHYPLRRDLREDYLSSKPKIKRQGPNGPCLIRML